MRRTTGLILTVVLLGAGTGCNTMANCRGEDRFFYFGEPPMRPPLPFGGVINDANMLAHVTAHGFGDGGGLCATMAVVDLPFSFVGDIVTLPWTTYEFIRGRNHPTDRYRQYPIGPPAPPQNAPNTGKD